MANKRNVIMLGRDAFESIEFRTEIVELPSMGGSVRIREMTAGKRDWIESQHATADGEITTTGLRAKFVIASVIDDNDEFMFSEKDTGIVSKMPADAVNEIFLAAQELNGMTGDPVKDAGKN